jgi:2-oxoglutarate ferredoxin oxidoreductase subunit alpha
MAIEITVGIGGAAGDGLDKTGDTLARSVARLGLHVFAYNSYQSLIRGGHTWLRLRIGEEKVHSHGDHLNVLIALNEDSIERHAREVEPGGAIIYNSSRLTCDSQLVPEGVQVVGLPVRDITKDLGQLLPVMQNTVALGALIHLAGFDLEVTTGLIAEIFSHKSDKVIEQNVNLLKVGYDYAVNELKPLGYDNWTFSRKRRPLVTGNLTIAMGAVAGGLKFYSAYPMSPATYILHWFADHSEKCGVLVKQAEDEIAVVNLAIGAGHAGVRSMCATSGGGFALMTEAISMAAMIETPVVIINVQRGGPSTGIPTKTEQGDLNQAIGASQGDFPRVIMAPKDATDCYYTSVEALNLAESFQLPVIILSDLMLGEHRSTVDPEALTPDVPIERGELLREAPSAAGDKNGYKRYAMTPSGVSPRVLPGTPGAVHVSATDEHDEQGVLISDEHTNSAIRRKMQEKRMRKMVGVLAKLPPPALEGPAGADVTLIGWGSTWGVIHEAAAQLTESGIRTNHLHFKYLHPFHAKEAKEILEACRRTVVVECNYSGQFARHLRAESGYSTDHLVTRYDGEPFEPAGITRRVRDIVEGRPYDGRVAEAEAQEIAYHFIRIHLKDKARPSRLVEVAKNGYGEPVWDIEIIDRAELDPRGKLIVGKETGSIHAWEPVAAEG